MQYIVSVAEQLYMQGSRGNSSGHGRMVKAEWSPGRRHSGLLDLLNAACKRFTLEEIYEALDGSQTFFRQGNLIKIHPAALARELELRMQACRLAAQQHNIGYDASDSFIAYLVHLIGICWNHWFWPKTKYVKTAVSGKAVAGIPNYLYRYEPTDAAPTIEEMEAVAHRALSPWGYNEDDIRGAIQFDGPNRKGLDKQNIAPDWSSWNARPAEHRDLKTALDTCEVAWRIWP
ncbi:hypothetical protein QFC24_005366 [Naganishia onofrii]|uniref:Uncharacterized protein n=1 Tax=Naganishia onofrii TaxID=1851511 RepID=A0ACC2XAG9_9TREE|nr:hypothetical protein QFC24_005366 [Naganishia onofrii]